jgi:hypothetical protein
MAAETRKTINILLLTVTSLLFGTAEATI